jgi:stearoyl-CoA desaturase (Delta-9 desaturase)
VGGGWLLSTQGRADWKRFTPDLYEDRGMRAINRRFTWSVNSVCHFLGSRRFDTDDRSTNVFWLALPSLGESWHHNHHAFPRSAVHGLRRWELDPSALIIGAMEKVGLARNVVRISTERQAERAV